MGERRSIKALFSPAVSLGAAGRDVFYEHGDGDIGLVCLYVEVGGVQVALDGGAARRVDAYHNLLQPLGLNGRVDFLPSRVNADHLAS